jgi:nickel/cobalt exporter
VKAVLHGRTVFKLATIVTVAAGILLAAGVVDAVLAQTGPFGVPRSQAPAASGFTGWILAKQSEFYRGLSGMIRSAKTDGTALWGLFGLSFAYGIFHAAGPGHGKAVISSYMVANEETWRRGVVLSFASAMLQALVAVLIVGIAAALIGATARMMGETVRWIEIVSYALIAALGARLLWVKGKAFLAACWALRRGPASDHQHDHHAHDHGRHEHSHGGHAHAAAGVSHECAHSHSHGKDHGHEHHHHPHDGHASAWGHAHAPEPDELAGPGGWRRGLTAIVAVGLRPCSGAILVLVFALAQGLFWAGVAATFIMGLGTAITVAAIATLTVAATAMAARIARRRSSYGTLVLRGIEVAAAALVLAFGLVLLTGYMASERMLL